MGTAPAKLRAGRKPRPKSGVRPLDSPAKPSDIVRSKFPRTSFRMKINGNEIRPSYVIEHNSSLWVAVKTQAVKPGKGPAYNQVELKNLLSGSKLNERFRSSETV